MLVVGGGYGGATAAKYLKKWGGRRVQVTLVEREAAFVSCPLSNLVLGGSRTIEDLTVQYTGLREAGVIVMRVRRAFGPVPDKPLETHVRLAASG